MPDDAVSPDGIRVVPVPAATDLRRRLWAWRGRLEERRRTRRAHRLLFDPDASPFALGILEAALRILGLRSYARREAWDLRVVENPVALRRLPPAFDGLRILHLSDPHLGVGRGFARHVAERVRGVAADLTVVTGDLRYHKGGPIEPSMEAFGALRGVLPDPVFAVLGNHDETGMHAPLTRMGVDVLVNEARRLERGDDHLHLVGVDDPHTFRTDSLEAALENVPPDGCRLLLAHAPEIHAEAGDRGLDWMICGHTHGGQLALPGGRPIVRNARCPRRIAVGAWAENGMPGYTTRGVGHSTIEARLFCRPEAVVHVLRRPAGP